jgi:predicted DNA-binding transcriptional regulator YafY
LETVAGVLVAFIEKRTWAQPALAKHLGVTVRTLRRCLVDLRESGVPLEQDPENRSCVYWSVPFGWLPGAAALRGEQVLECARLLARLPQTDSRDRIFVHLLRGTDRALARNHAPGAPHESALAAAEDALSERRPIRVRYRSTTANESSERTISVQRIVYGDRPRVVAFCHRAKELRWFRVDRIQRTGPDAYARFEPVATTDVDAFVRESIDGFRSKRGAQELAFIVRSPASRWAISNLPAMDAIVAEHDGGIRVVCRTAGDEILARWLVGLGGSVWIETVSLRDQVVAIARQVLANDNVAAQRPLAKGTPAPAAGERASKRRSGDQAG